MQHSTGAYHSADAEGSSSAAEKAVPGIIAVVHPEFFTRASAVAVQLLKVSTDTSVHQSMPCIRLQRQSSC